MFRGQTRFRAPNWQKWASIAGAVVVTIVTLLQYLYGSLTWIFWSLLAMSIGSVIAIAATFTTAIDLQDSNLIVRKNFHRSSINRSEIEEVTWASGCGVSIRLSSGRWVAMPDVGRNSQSLCNSLRAWVSAA